MGWPRFKLDPAAERTLVQLTEALDHFSNIGVTLMSAIDDLTAAVTAATAEVGQAIAVLEAETASVASLTKQLADAISASGSTDPQIAALSQALTASTASLTSAVTAAAAVLPQTAPASPSPAPAE